MKILIVEDDENKRTRLVDFLNELYPSSSLEVAKSLQSGVRKLRSNAPDVILLDMTLPTYDIGPDESGGSTHAYGGREFLRQMKRFKLSSPVIVVTQFDTFGSGDETMTLAALDEELKKSHPGVYLGAVYYHASIQSWKEHLRNFITKADAK
jgi:CheY-like chemotaxis protein